MSIPPKTIMTVFIVKPGAKSNTAPVKIVEILRETEPFEFDPNNLAIIMSVMFNPLIPG